MHCRLLCVPSVVCLLYLLLAYAFLTIASLCNIRYKETRWRGTALQRDEIVGKGVTAQTTAGDPKGTLQDGKPAHERGPTMQEQEHTNKAPSSQPRQETPNEH